MESSIATIEPQQTVVAHNQPSDGSHSETAALIAVLNQAIANPNIDIDRMERLVNIAITTTERLDANRAKKAYAAAMARFKKNPPKIVKDAHVAYQNRDNTWTEYDHATLGHVCEAVISGLAEVGISHSWRKVTVDKQLIQVVTKLSHELGHFEEFPSIPAAPDTSGGKNSIQAVESTVTYLRRSGLFDATGLSALAPPDIDGRTPKNLQCTPNDSAEPSEFVTDQQVADLDSLITEKGGNKAKLLKFLRLDSLSEIRAERYDSVVAEVNRLARQKEDANIKKQRAQGVMR